MQGNSKSRIKDAWSYVKISV